jgi:membrane protein required for colicin V production
MRVADFNFFDWLLLSILGFSMFMAFRRGLIRAIFGLLGFVGGFQLATWSYETLGDWINEGRVITSQPMGRILAFLLVVVAVAAAFELLGRLLQKSLRAIGFSTLDRILGVAFGFARGCLIGIGLLMSIATFAPQAQLIRGSALSPYLFAVAHDVSFLVPPYFQRLMAQGAFNLRQGPPRWIIRH